MKNKIIFLDIDGVLRTVTDINFNKRSIGNLNNLIRKTNAKIVITSTWKNEKGLSYVKEILENQGLKGDIIDETPHFTLIHPDYGELNIPRGMEIKCWLEKNTKMEFLDGEPVVNFIENYVILDDHSDMLIEQNEHFIKIDPTKGFDGRYMKRAIEILNKENYETVI